MSTPSGLVAVTVLGNDRPGIVAEVTAALADLGCNLEDSTMTLLRGHFAMVVLVHGAGSTQAVEEALTPLSRTGHLAVDVRPLPEDSDATRPGTAYTVHVHGADRPGIVAAMTNVVARHGGNIVDLSSRLRDGLYVLVAEFVLPAERSVDVVENELATVSQDLGVDFYVAAVDEDLL